MAPPLERNAVLVDRRDLSETLAVFRVRPDDVPQPGEAWFEPGQYVAIGLDVPGARAIRRPYSVASPPEDRAGLELCVRRVAASGGTQLSHLLFDLSVGDRLHVGRRFAGDLTLGRTVGEDDPRRIVLVAAGTGIAPFASIVRSAALRASPALSRIALLHGAREVREIAFADDLSRIVGPRHLRTVSRPDPTHPTEWSGRVETFFDPGRVEEVERRIGLAPGGLVPDRAVVFVCGVRGAIVETVRKLLPRGFLPRHPRLRRELGIGADAPATLFFEQFDDAPLFGPDDLPLLRNSWTGEKR